jgi:hypothetical protein
MIRSGPVSNPEWVKKNTHISKYFPPVGPTLHYRMWIALWDDARACLECKSMHGKIYLPDEVPEIEPPRHPNCRCEIDFMQAAQAGTATEDGENGADYYVFYFGRLPGNYISKEQAKELGWNRFLGNLAEVAPGKMIGGDVYKNKNGHLPAAPGRVWYEADINYTRGFRTTQRLLYSSDGLLFVTYDHYRTFFEII